MSRCRLCSKKHTHQEHYMTNRYEIRDREDSECRAHIWEVFDTHTADKATVARFFNAGRAEWHCDKANQIKAKRLADYLNTVKRTK